MSYKGLVAKLPVGQRGFTGTLNKSQAGPDQLLLVNGVELIGGLIQKEGGAQKFNAAALDGGATITAGISWAPVPGTQHQVVITSTGKALRDAGAATFATSLRTGLVDSREPPPLFTLGGGETVGQPRKLFMTSENNQMQVVLGAAALMASISAPAADWTAAFPTFSVMHNLRHFAGGNSSDPHRIYYTGIADHQDFAGGGTLAIYPGEGERLVAGYSFNNLLILWKYPTGIYIVDTSNASPASWSVSKFSQNVGTLSGSVIVPGPMDCFYMDHVGNVHSMGATQKFGDVYTSDVGKASFIDQFIRDRINLNNIRRAVGIWYAAKQQLWYALPVGSVDDNTLRLMSDMPQAGSARFFMSERDTCVSMWMHPDAFNIPRPMAGDDLGFIYRLDSPSLDKAGAAYPMAFTTADNDMSFLDPSLAAKNKIFQFLEVVIEPSGDFDLNVEVSIDGVLTSTVNFTLGGGGAVLGEFLLGTDVLGENFTRRNRQKINGSGKVISLAVSNSDVGAAVEIAGFYVYFTIGDENTARNNG